MPLQVKDYEWSETENVVIIHVPLKGVKPGKADIFSTNKYIKVSFPPYIFEVVLFEHVNEDESKATVDESQVTFTLKKLSPAHWGQLKSPESDDKEFMRLARDEALGHAQKSAQENAKKREEYASEKKQFALRNQMRLEQEERTKIENIKQDERQKATDDIEQWKKAQVHQIIPAPRMPTPSAPKADIFLSESGGKKASPPVEEMPAPRSSGHITISFTHRVFPTPSRESQASLEEEWLKKQADAQKMVPIEEEEFSDHEKDVEWLKSKAASLFGSENYQAAISVYNHAIRLFPKMAALYSNRAACHLKERNLMKCVEDCSRALELLDPPVDQNAESRRKAHIRRGSAFCEFELYVEGLQDYEAALKIRPDDEGVRRDAERIRAIIQGTCSTSDATDDDEIGESAF